MENQNTKHTVIIPSYNTLSHLKNTYNSLIKHGGDVEIIIIDDASQDGTAEYLKTLKASNLTVVISPERRGHTYWYDEGMRMSTTEVVSILHSDMIIGPKYFDNMLKHLKPGTVVCGTRIEPPIHPAGKEKITIDFGDEADTFKWDAFEHFVTGELIESEGKTTKGIFAPWMLYKQDHLEIGGHDQKFTPYGYEDSDIFNRWILRGYKIVQSRDALCYHMTCRGHRWNRGVGIVNSDYEATMNRCRKEYLRKWGSWIKNDEFQYPILDPKYNIAFMVKHCTSEILELLEPWCDRIYIDDTMQVITSHYIDKEQSNTKFDLSKRIYTLEYNDPKLENDIVVEFDMKKFDQQSFNIIQQLPEIIKESGEVGEFELDVFKITINSLTEYQNDLIVCKN
jgi:glycosyltransferase involved in cell wall biosynthesis